MRRISVLRVAITLVTVALGVGVPGHIVTAQSLMDRIKKAAEDAQKAGQKQPQPTPQQGQTPPKPPAPTAGQPQANTAAAAGDCCSPDALKTIAASVGFLDIVGIKLGMTPEQAFAAVKAFNPQMKIDIIKSRVESPDAPGTYTAAPQFAIAHTVGKRPYPSYPEPFTLPDGSADVIVMEFTIPPSPPLVGKVVRQTTFPIGQPVVASNLVEALRKKYGEEHHPEPFMAWVFDTAGKPVTRPLQGQEQYCAPGNPFDGFGWNGGGSMPGVDDLQRDSPLAINVTTTRDQDSRLRSAACRAFVVADAYPLGEATPPRQQMNLFTVGIESPALLYGSQKATHDWLQAKGDAKAKQQEDAAKARSAPKL